MDCKPLAKQSETEKTNVSEGKGCMTTDTDVGDEGSLKNSLKNPYFNKPQTPKEMDQSLDRHDLESHHRHQGIHVRCFTYNCSLRNQSRCPRDDKWLEKM